MRLNYYLLLILTFLSTATIVAQDRLMKGFVSDPAGLPLPGVNVIVKDTDRGTQTDFDGKYSIEINEGETLVFSFIGFSNQEIKYTDQNEISVVLKEELNSLDEIIVVGYGTQSKRTLTDNIVKLDSDDIKEVPVSNFQSTLVGKAAGVQITQNNGKVEGGLNIRVRGAASLTSGTQPLYVLDGIPLYNSDESNNQAPVNPLISLSPNEIESIEILKDASAVAIYGSRGANGVVIITTKKGKEGKTQFSLNTSHGFSSPTNTREFLNSAQYVELFTEAAINSVGAIFDTEADAISFVEGRFDRYSNNTDWRNGVIDTDWVDLALRDGEITDADFSMSGGNSKTNFFFSGSVSDNKGIVQGNDLLRYSSRANINHKFNDRFSLGMNLSYSRTEIDRIANDNAFVTPLQSIAQTPLTAPFLEDGTANPNTLYANFLLQDQNAFYKTKIRRVIGRLFSNYEFIDGLKLNSSFAYDLYAQTEDQYIGSLAPFQSTNGSAFASSVDVENYIISNYFSYDKVFKDIHTLSLVAGTELNKTTRRFISVTSNQFPSDDFQTVTGGAEVVAGAGSETAFAFLSYFARATYDFKGKYLFKASIRRDGSSRFGVNERFGIYPALSGGWIISNEDFMNDSEVLSFLKIRVSWGDAGNAEINNFPSRFLFGAVAYNQRPGISFTQAGNPDLTWETTEQTDIGLEYGFLNNRITGEIDYYVKSTGGLLFNEPLVPSAGGPNNPTVGDPTISRNIGELRNTGVEFTLNTKNILTENFSWSTNFNISNNENEIISLPNGNQDIINGQNINRVGEVANAFFLLEYAGVDPANGDALYILNSENADGSLNKETTTNANEANRIAIGNPFPEWYGGLTNNISYKNVDFSFTLQGEFGASIYNGGGRFMSASADFFDNQTIDQLDRWQQPGDITDVPQVRLFQGNGTAQSTRYLEEANFVRLRNITLGYSLPVDVIQKYGFSNIRIYLTGVNLLTFTNYEGFDPEARTDAAGVRGGTPNPGQEFYSAPPAKVLSLGLNLNF
ncbi:TonB-dependent receptor [Aquimarina sp. ERC-38]|uniref:SusC/RagA family TonB-linked outer membrane protein n=1 Tax=Aquimarina sp. ERC-38 TaxID=2949996 RepID=UPI0022453A94|nr:TonB-dependent receptor [Aquimarina sp. ERC-38]UZO80468.1 TonB-dependent receptor [Aquimarina sp. ERC-38]